MLDSSSTQLHLNGGYSETVSGLSALDRCDQCGARAYVRVTLKTGQLMFCAHHARKAIPKISDLAVSIEDQTASLLA